TGISRKLRSAVRGVLVSIATGGFGFIGAIEAPNTAAVRGSRQNHTCFRWADRACRTSYLEADLYSRSVSLQVGSKAAGRAHPAQREIHRESPGTRRVRSLHTCRIVASFRRGQRPCTPGHRYEPVDNAEV